jgi:hypothetical protein
MWLLDAFPPAVNNRLEMNGMAASIASDAFLFVRIVVFVDVLRRVPPCLATEVDGDVNLACN